MKLRALLLATTFLVAPTAAAAAPVTGFFLGLAGASATTGAVAAALGAGTFFQVGAFLGTTLLGNLLLSVGLSYLQKLLGPGAPDRPKIEAARVNTNIPDAPRWQLGGSVIVGGHGGIFGEHDESGNFWFIVAHGDAELTGTPTYYLDGIEVTLSDGTDGFTAGDVLTDDFCLTDIFDQYEGSGTKVPYFRLYTVTPDASNVYGALPSAFTTAFPSLATDFRLAGVAFTIVRCKAVALEHYSKVYRWRGLRGLGEPGLAVYANFSRMYDPRESAHDINDSTTWTPSDGNAAIVWGWWRTNAFGMGFDMADVDWAEVETAADICDETVLDRSGVSTPLYKCGIAADDTETRQSVERSILLTMDGFVAYSDAGLAYPVAGKYAAPTLTFSAQRDILTEATQIVDDGETQLDGVVVSYLSPDHRYTKQPAAAWVNNDYYVTGAEPNYQFIDILACQNHNQAVRLAKAMGQRIGATKKAALGTTIKGILAKRERIISLDLDTEFQGAHEIVTPVQESPDGIACAFAVVPVASDRWTLAAGEEGVPPQVAPALNIDTSLAVAASVVITAESVQTSTGLAVRLAATFAAPTRVDRFYRFRYADAGGTNYEYFQTDMDNLKAFSAIVQDGQAYDVQWRTVTAGGRASEWAADVGGGETEYEITATANPTAPATLTASNAVPGAAGEIDYSWTTANDANQYSAVLYRGSTSSFGAASVVTTILSGANIAGAFTETGVAAGTEYCWLVPANGSGIEGTESGPYTVIVT